MLKSDVVFYKQMVPSFSPTKYDGDMHGYVHKLQ